ncbi:MBL fold metallo-hydrolase [Jatrophihabitans telluris]|uniref:MBL fold metallo-hydrolase n=1 Tax=Jatrophihabitans telluris TaxID=2038343 RepID=A0ABY4QVF1_9ACTN|nr:MBL fold metallo-hydrolase [Jatrophihabitans telluris]UQX87413.1 MBL fold metallo-hydrolase [Jatrophihabitans telluris]
MKITHYGHACLLIETATARLLIDPGTMSSFAEVRDLDAVLVTHQHPDHLDVAGLTALLGANPRAQLVLDPDSAAAVPDLPEGTVASPGQRLTFGASTVDVLGGLHAAVYGDVPGCTNSAYLIDDGALLHPGDSLFVPTQDVDVLAVAIDGPWLKLAEAVDYVRAVGPRVALPIHEGETTDPAKYAGMLQAFSPAGVVTRLTAGEPSEL